MAEKEIKHAGSDRVKRSYFDKSRREEYTILIPDMLPIHFKLIMAIYKKYGYNMELLQNCSRNVIDEGLKNTHNDACYPALLVIGQFMDALKSGKYAHAFVQSVQALRDREKFYGRAFGKVAAQAWKAVRYTEQIYAHKEHLQCYAQRLCGAS